MSVELNLVPTDPLVGHAIQPDGCPPADVTTILVTRYWVDPTEGALNVHADVEYFKRRAELFLHWCLPSVTAQTRIPDAWLILVSERVHLMLGPDVLRAIRDLPYAHVVEVPEGRSFSSIARAWVTARAYRIREPWTVVARLDNDDSIARDYVHTLGCWVSRARPATPATLVFPFGVQHDTTTGHTTVDMHSTNHFTAVTYRRGQTDVMPYGPAHTEIYTDRAKYKSTATGIHQILTRYPMWAEILHDDNAANHLRPGPQILTGPGQWVERFAVAPHDPSTGSSSAPHTPQNT